MSLSQLLSEARAIHESSLIDLSIAQEPQEQWKRRSISYFNEKSTTCIQDRSGIEKHHPRIEVRILLNYFTNIHSFYIVANDKPVRWTESIPSCPSTGI